jgi:hypothetical protein
LASAATATDAASSAAAKGRHRTQDRIGVVLPADSHRG